MTAGTTESYRPSNACGSDESRTNSLEYPQTHNQNLEILALARTASPTATTNRRVFRETTGLCSPPNHQALDMTDQATGHLKALGMSESTPKCRHDNYQIFITAKPSSRCVTISQIWCLDARRGIIQPSGRLWLHTIKTVENNDIIWFPHDECCKDRKVLVDDEFTWLPMFGDTGHVNGARVWLSTNTGETLITHLELRILMTFSKISRSDKTKSVVKRYTTMPQAKKWDIKRLNEPRIRKRQIPNFLPQTNDNPPKAPSTIS
jgi:hypothetical protein